MGDFFPLCLFFLVPYLGVLRDYCWLCVQGMLIWSLSFMVGVQEIKYGARDQTWISFMLGTHPNHCTITLAPNIFFCLSPPYLLCPLYLLTIATPACEICHSSSIQDTKSFLLARQKVISQYSAIPLPSFNPVLSPNI